MTIIVIKDLTESADLDRHAMVAIKGGARTRGRQPSIGSTIFSRTRIVIYPTGFASTPVMPPKGQSIGKTRTSKSANTDDPIGC